MRAKRPGIIAATRAAARRAAALGRAWPIDRPRTAFQPPAAWTSPRTLAASSRGLRTGWPASAPRSARSLASSTNRASTSARAVTPMLPMAEPAAGGAAAEATAIASWAATTPPTSMASPAAVLAARSISRLATSSSGRPG